MTIDYSIITRSEMLVEVNGKKMVITGEGTTIPNFYADIQSMTKWEKPFEDIVVTEDDKNKIINYITQESIVRGIEVIFE